MSTLAPGPNYIGTFADPFLLIQSALDNPMLAPFDIIYVKNDGIYFENLTWPQIDAVSLIGYDSVTPGLRTVIDGIFNSERVITMIDSGVGYSNATKLINLSIWNGTAPLATNGGGILIQGYASPTVENTDINQCSADGNGGGMFIQGVASPILKNVSIDNCYAQSGGGIYFIQERQFVQNGGCWLWVPIPPCELTEVSITSCWATSWNGGGIYVSSFQQGSMSTCPEIDVITPTIVAYDLQILRNNALFDGAGIYSQGAYIFWNGGVVESNISKRNGGGLCAMFSKTNIKGVDFNENESEKGGAAYFERGLQFDNSCHLCNGIWDGIEHNWEIVRCISNKANQGSFQSGGALYFDGLSNSLLSNYIDFVFTNGEIKSNESLAGGGGISVFRTTTLYLKNINISYNEAISNGGGINNFNGWSFVTNSANTGFHHFEQLLLTKNIAGNRGGAIHTSQAFSCLNSTIAENRSANWGGAISCIPYYAPGLIEMDVNPAFFNSILWGNINSSNMLPSQVYCEGDLCDPQFAFCAVEGWSTPNPIHNFWVLAPYSWDDQFWSLPVSNTGLNPNFINPANDDYNIHMNNSSCYNSGNDVLLMPLQFPSFGSYFAYMWPFDFQGNARHINDTIDIGAYETTTPKNSSIIPNIFNMGERAAMEIYPNPIQAGQLLTILTNFVNSRCINIEIINNLGQRVFNNSIKTRQEPLYEFLWPYHIDDPGIYLLRIQNIDFKGNCKYYFRKVCLTR